MAPQRLILVTSMPFGGSRLPFECGVDLALDMEADLKAPDFVSAETVDAALVGKWRYAAPG
jgi:hypothetical protein